MSVTSLFSKSRSLSVSPLRNRQPTAQKREKRRKNERIMSQKKIMTQLRNIASHFPFISYMYYWVCLSVNPFFCYLGVLLIGRCLRCRSPRRTSNPAQVMYKQVLRWSCMWHDNRPTELVLTGHQPLVGDLSFRNFPPYEPSCPSIWLVSWSVGRSSIIS